MTGNSNTLYIRAFGVNYNETALVFCNGVPIVYVLVYKYQHQALLGKSMSQYLGRLS